LRGASVKKLVAIDGNSLMYRAFYALPAMTARDGTPTGAVYGFISMLLKLLSYEPGYMLAAFDLHGPTFRHLQYDGYKQGRKPTPEELKAQFPIIKEILTAMGIAVCQCEGYEADDLLGTYARLANEAGVEALLVTGDRDALQLISPQTHVLMTKKGITDTVEYDEAVLMEQYGLAPERMPDLKGLMGDASDNLPGIPGVGEKTALKLLQKYGSLENALANAEGEKGALRQKLMEHGESARMSYRLGIIDVNAPVERGLEGCAFSPEGMAGAIPLMNKLELRSLVSRLPKGAAAVPAEPEAKARLTEIDNTAALNELIAGIPDGRPVAAVIGEGLELAFDGETRYVISLGGDLLTPGLSPQEAMAAIGVLMQDESRAKYFFDSKAARHSLAAYNIELKGRVFDAMIADYLLHAIHPAPTLAALCAEKGIEPSAAALMGLVPRMERELEEKGLMWLYREVELPLTGVLFSMEREGFTLDKEALRAMSGRFGERLSELEQGIYGLCGESFNILSPKQLGGILFEKLGLPPQKKTKSGYSTDAEVLEKLEDKHPVIKLILEYRFLSKLKSTFVDGLLAMVKPDGRVYTSFNQNVTATGRISSTEPNLQNIPVRTELGREIRRAFVAREGHILIGADYSQIELRLLAHISGDEGMINAFNSGADIHQSTAAEVFGVPLDSVTREQRSAAKAVNFGIVYGISDFGLARSIGVSRREAGEFIARYLERYPGIREYMARSVAQGREEGYVSTLMGRRRELPELASSNYNTRSFGERVAMNMPIQGSAADIIKLAMVRVHRTLKERGLQARLILQIHDELIIDAPVAEAEAVKELLLSCMQGVMELKVPLTAEVSAGRSWYDTK